MTTTRHAAFFDTEQDESDRLCATGPDLPGWELTCYPQSVQLTETDFAGVECISVFIGSDLTAAQLARFPDLKLVATRSTGYDHIDLNACRARGIGVCNVPRYGETTVAEHTFGLMLALSRKIFKAYERTRQGNFALKGLLGFDLHGKTLGVVGAGAIGLHVLRIGRALGMNCLAFDARPVPILAEVLDFTYTDLDTLLASSDVVSLHVPLLPTTRHLINADSLSRMRPGALLINTARGELVDTAALLAALDSGRLAGAGLDVFEGEEFLTEEDLLLRTEATREQLQTVITSQALLRRENVVLTPHLAFYSEEALGRILEITVANIHAYFAGSPQNLVT
ncbi:MAG TPA: NAD(P)-dependent oxidoreductase [Armatimonadota bacterium]|jgi:D-lactate dehydrogenase